jgi:hypothetical protein
MDEKGGGLVGACYEGSDMPSSVIVIVIGDGNGRRWRWFCMWQIRVFLAGDLKVGLDSNDFHVAGV